MKTSIEGVLKIISHEGIVLGPYYDSVGVLTVYIGHTANAGGLNPAKMQRVDTRNWTDERVEEEIVKAIETYLKDLTKYEKRVNSAVKVDLEQHEFDALVSFDLNTGGVYRAILTEDINKGVKNGNGFMGWLRPKEVYSRRKAEQDLFRTGDYQLGNLSIPVYDALPSGKKVYRKRMSGEEIKGYMSVPKTTKTLGSILRVLLDWTKTFNKRP